MGKSALKNKKAQEAQRIQRLDQALKKNTSLHKNPIKIFKALKEEEITFRDLPWDSYYGDINQLLDRAKLKVSERKRFYELALAIGQSKGKKLLYNLEAVGVLTHIAKYYHLKREIDLSDWKPKTHNLHKQLSDLIRYIFADYDVPRFMDEAFYNGVKLHIRWFIHIGRGYNIRTAVSLPFNLTKKMAHHFLKAPVECSIKQAMRYGQVKALGGDERLAGAIYSSRLGDSFENNEFWESVIRFFVKLPMLDPAQVLPIIDYIQNVKFGGGRVVDPLTGMVVHNQEPEKPNFSMKGRTIDSLLRDVEKWHKGLNKLRTKAAWEGMLIPDFIHEEGTEKNKKIYHITQLLNSAELQAEGRYMKHCVASYVYSCARGSSSIWSMTVRSEAVYDVSRLVTIELNRNKSIVQVRGKYNALPNDKTKSVIKKWMAKEGLKASKWAMNY